MKPPRGLPTALDESSYRMATKLEKELKREITIGKSAYIIRINPTGLKLTEKGRRKGTELLWKDLVTGEAALATALNASLAPD